MFHLFSVDHSEIALYVAASLILSFHIAMHIEIPQHLSLSSLPRSLIVSRFAPFS